MVHPDPLTVIAPAVTLLAGRVAILLHHSHFSPRIHRARMPVHVIGRTRNRVALVRSFVPVRVHRKICPASMVHPDPLTVIAPAITLLAGRVAILLHHPHFSPRIHRARMPVHVIGRTRNRVALVRSFVPVRVHRKICPASMVHPDPLTVIAPAITLLAGRVAILLHHPHFSPCIHRARVPVHVIGGTRNRVALIRSCVPIRVHGEIRPAAMVHPDPLTVIAPAVTLLAGRGAILLHHPHFSPRIHRAGVPLHLCGGARSRVPLIRSCLPIRVHGEIRPAAMVHPDPLTVIAPAVTLL